MPTPRWAPGSPAMTFRSPFITATLVGATVVTLVVVAGVGFHLGLFDAMARPAPEGAILDAIGVGLAIWAVLVSTLVVIAYRLGPRAERQMASLAQAVAASDRPEATLARAEHTIGAPADALRSIASRISSLDASLDGERSHVAALYQISPHPTLLCSLDGEVVEGNPAFYALSGKAPTDIRGVHLSTLDTVFPVSDLEAYAIRSLKEGSAISGLEASFMDHDGEARPVEVALRAFRSNGRALVLYQVTDKAHERRLEQRVASFADTLDLMVDQRVRQLTAGRQELGSALDAAGVALASFDAAGGTLRWNRPMQRLTRRARGTVPDFSAAMEALAIGPDQALTFARWFWASQDESFVATHPTLGRRMLWRRADNLEPGATDRRTLVGIPLPALQTMEPSGDGLALSFEL